jgi:two-component sensor histidine kinase/PAS domain-containing protein
VFDRPDARRCMTTLDRALVILTRDLPWPFAFASAIVLVAAALAVRLWIVPLDAGMVYLAFFPAVLVACLIGGIGPALFATLLAILASVWFLLPPFDGSGGLPDHVWSAPVFFAAALLCCVPVELLRRAARRARDASVRLADSEARFRLAARAFTGLVYDWNVVNDTVLWSEGVAELIGTGPGDPDTDVMQWRLRVDADDLPRIDRVVREALTGRAVTYDVQYKVRHDDGRWIDVWDRGLIVRDVAGVAVRVVGSTVDISAQRRLSLALEESLRRRDAALTEVHHRVKNSLQTVSSLLSLQVRRIKDPAVRREFEDAIARIHAIASAHQTLYRDEEMSRANVQGFIETLTQQIRAAHDRGGASFRCTVSAGEVILPTDQVVPFALVVNELLTNAFKHAAEQDGTIEIAVNVQVADGAVHLTVIDGGRGLPPGFDPEGGDGMGMMLVNLLVRQMRGRLTVERPPRGSRFVVTVPLEPAGRPAR